MRKYLVLLWSSLFEVVICGCNRGVDMVNPFFPYSDGQVLEYKGNFLFDEEYSKEGKVYVSVLKEYSNGKVMKLEFDTQSDIENREIYFFVNQHEIWKLFQNISYETVPMFDVEGNGVLVFTDDLFKIPVGSYVQHYEDSIEYTYSYSNSATETGYFERLTFISDKGIVRYSCGFGALRDYVDVRIIY